MPYATVERSFKRLRSSSEDIDVYAADDEDIYAHYYFPPHLDPHPTTTPGASATRLSNDWGLQNTAPMLPSLSTTSMQGMFSHIKPFDLMIDTTKSHSDHCGYEDPLTPLDLAARGSVDMNSSLADSLAYEDIPGLQASNDNSSDNITIRNSPDELSFHNPHSPFRVSYSDHGNLNLEARLANVSDLRTLIDAFSQLCTGSSSPSPSPVSTPATTPSADSSSKSNGGNSSTTGGIVLYRNRSLLTKPANFFASVSALGQLLHPHSKHGPLISLRAITDVCIQTYFSCWVRHVPLLHKEEFLAWYNKHANPADTLIVNAVCCYSFRHAVIHHANSDVAQYFLEDINRVREQEEFFFNRARDCLAQSFDSPDRHMVVALLLMCTKADRSKLHHYAGMAVSALHGLDIYPRMTADKDSEVDDSYEKEMDTRLWWYAWAIDFYLYSAFGAPRSTPQTRVPGAPIDAPRIFEQDVDEAAEMGVLALTYCLELWKIQSDIIAALYENESSDMTVEQLQAFDGRILAFYRALPAYLQLDSGFEYGSEDLFMVCLRVNAEYNATRILLHKFFIPDVNDRHPSHFSLQSLNICLSTALRQLRTLNTCSKIHKYRCSFDRDELWRASEIISTAMDIYRSCGSDLIFAHDVDRDEYEVGLEKALQILKATRDYQIRSKDWIQVADWLEVEIRRHKLYNHAQPQHQHQHPGPSTSPTRASAPDYFLANLKPSARQHHYHHHQQQQQHSPTITITTTTTTIPAVPPNTDSATTLFPTMEESHHELTPSGAMLSVLSFPNASHTTSAVKNTISSPSSTPPPPPPPSTPSSFTHSIPSSSSPPYEDYFHHHHQQQQLTPPSPMSPPPPPPPQSSSKSFVQFSPYTPPTPTSLSSRSTNGTNSNKPSQTRFRYFNPRKMNKFLFIDENPTL